MRRMSLPAAALTLVAPLLLAVPPAAAAGGGPDRRPVTYDLPGDPGGSRFEGIGVDPRDRVFYVTETTGGEVHRGDVRTGATEEWLPEGVHGRTTARGITTDEHGRVYVAGGPNGMQTGGPDLWVHAPDGRLLAALRTGLPEAFLNDVAIGPDGAAYVTDSTTPRVFRVAREDGRWQLRLWLDASGTVTRQPGFNLGGIVVSPDRRALVVAQGNVGILWRVDLATRAVTRVDTGDAVLPDADGLVLDGSRLVVVRNFARTITTVRLDPAARRAELVAETPTDPARVFTTAEAVRDRLLLVDSKFEEQVPAPPYQVVALPMPR